MSINHLSFNNVVTHLTCSTDQGYLLYGLQPDLDKITCHNSSGGIGITKMLNKTNILMLVGGGTTPFKSKDIMILWDNIKNEQIFEVDMKGQIKNVHVNKTHMVAVLDKKICLFDWRGKCLDTKSTFSNDKGLCVVNGNMDVIATLGINKGDVAVWKYKSDIYKTIKAHLTNIEAIALNNDGKYIATASETGTLIRVFNVETEKQEYEFRRGSQSAFIHDICFSNDTKFLACCSGNGTIHIWDLNNDSNGTKNTQSMLSGFKGYLPQYFSSQWGMKQLSLGDVSKSICAFDEHNDLHIATYDGNYYKVAGRTGEFINIAKGLLHPNNK